MQQVSVLSIDAWRNGSGWDWNQWYAVGQIDVSVCDLPTRELLRTMRDEGYLSAASAGKVTVDDDGYNIVIAQRSDGMPLFAIAYGEALDGCAECERSHGPHYAGPCDH